MTHKTNVTSEDRTRLACGIEEVDLVHFERHAEESHADHWSRTGQWLTAVETRFDLSKKKAKPFMGTR